MDIVVSEQIKVLVWFTSTLRQTLFQRFFSRAYGFPTVIMSVVVIPVDGLEVRHTPVDGLNLR